MELIYTDPIGKELGYILNANVDMEMILRSNLRDPVGMVRLSSEVRCMFRTQSMAE